MRWRYRSLIIAPFMLFALAALAASCSSGDECSGSFDSSGNFVPGRCPQPGPQVGFTIKNLTVCEGPPPGPSVSPTPCPQATSTSVETGDQIQFHAQAFLEKKDKERLEDVTTASTTLWTSTNNPILQAPSAGNGGRYLGIADGCACIRASSGGLPSLPIDVGVFTSPAAPPVCAPCPTPLPTSGAVLPRAADALPLPDGTDSGILQWTYNARAALAGEIVAGPDGDAYFITVQNLLHGVGRDGRVALVRPAVGGAPAVASDGTIVVAQSGGRLAGFAPDGSRRWTTELGADARSLVASDNMIYAATGAEIFRVGANGTVEWRVGTDEPLAAAALPTGGVAVASSTGAVTAYSPSGAIQWTATVAGGSSGSITADADGVYAASNSGVVSAFDVNGGGEVWRIDTGAQITSGPATDGAGHVVFVADAVYSVSSDGAVIRRYDIIDARLATPLRDGSGRMLVAGAGETAAMLSGDGAELWATRSFGEVTSATASGDGEVFVANVDGRIFAVR
jgi:hypothetical protein